ncbi:MAG: hypothetical protein U9R21_03840 [Candidatus Thermoplasmatota archaeon]|nr:hypothetical protein [Candidatus Thermoplasmatota archaeon]
MMIVGQVSNPKEAEEIEFITESFVVGIRARTLALKARRKTSNA